MNRMLEKDATPAEEWEAALNATCNRLQSQYVSLIRAASSASALEEMRSRQDPRSGGGVMKLLSEPPPPVAADAAMSELQARLAVENLCVTSSHLLGLIRTLRLSVLLMDEDTIAAEEVYQVIESQATTQRAQEEANALEEELMKLRNQL